jgi:hypothetical protein
MATWRERRAWRGEFKSLGTRQVRDRERISAWYQTPGKLEEARRWLREQERRPYLIGAAIGALATIAAAVVAALISGAERPAGGEGLAAGATCRECRWWRGPSVSLRLSQAGTRRNRPLEIQNRPLSAWDGIAED